MWVKENKEQAVVISLVAVFFIGAVSYSALDKSDQNLMPPQTVVAQANLVPPPQSDDKPQSREVVAKTKVDEAPKEAKTVADRMWRTIVANAAFGCADADLEDRIGSLMSQNDDRAWKGLLLRSLANGSCRRWFKGDKVYLDEVGFLRHCLRPSGETDCYWTIREAVSSN